MSESVIKTFLSSKLVWIRKQINKVERKPKIVENEYKTLEKVYYLGTSYNLNVIEAQKNNIEIVGDDIVFYCKSNSTFAMRKKCFDNWYKNTLKKKSRQF